MVKYPTTSEFKLASLLTLKTECTFTTVPFWDTGTALLDKAKVLISYSPTDTLFADSWALSSIFSASCTFVVSVSSFISSCTSVVSISFFTSSSCTSVVSVSFFTSSCTSAVSISFFTASCTPAVSVSFFITSCASSSEISI